MAQEATFIDETIAALEAWRDRIDASIETLRYMQVQGPGLPSLPPPASGRPLNGQVIPHDAFFQMTIPEAARKYLGIMKKTKPNPELAAALISGGLKSASKNFPEMVRTVLSRDERFIRVNSEWGLSEWYPGQGKGRKAKAGTEPEESVVGGRPSQKHSIPDGTKKAKPLGPGKKRIVKFLDDHPDEMFGPIEIATKLQAKPKTMNVYLGYLVRDGLISRPQEGKYQSKRKS
jgi:hypothetical protein